MLSTFKLLYFVLYYLKLLKCLFSIITNIPLKDTNSANIYQIFGMKDSRPPQLQDVCKRCLLHWAKISFLEDNWFGKAPETFNKAFVSLSRLCPLHGQLVGASAYPGSSNWSSPLENIRWITYRGSLQVQMITLVNRRCTLRQWAELKNSLKKQD